MLVRGKLLAVALVFGVSFFACASAQSELSCFDGVCEGDWTDGVCQYSIEKKSTSAPSSHDIAANPLVCVEAKFTCSDALPSGIQTDACTTSEKADGVTKKTYMGMYKDDCDALNADAAVTSATCCTGADCNTPSGTPDASNPSTLLCYTGFCLEDDSDAECRAKLQVTLNVADPAHDIEADPLGCVSFFFVCTARYDQGEDSCTAPEAANAVVKRRFLPAYTNECATIKENGQSYVGAFCCNADLCNEPGSILPGGAASLRSSSLLVWAGMLVASLALFGA